MKNRILSIFASFLILLSITIVPAVAAPSGNEKVAVIIGFKDKPDAALVKAYGGDVKQQYTIIPAIAADVPAKALYGLSHNPKITIIELDAVAHTMGQVTPWGIERVQAPAVHANNIVGTGISVAILDTGIDYNHPDLAANYKGGFDFVNTDSDPIDDAGHGTHVAGTVAAIDNYIGVIGAAPGVNLYGVKVLGADGSGYYSYIISALQWAVDNNMDVASMSLSGTFNSPSLETACNNAYDSGVVLVAAAGNDGKLRINYPAAYSSVIAVAATDINDIRARFSTYGPQIELSAPGVGISSTILGDGYSAWSGTSMATPHVTGAVALLMTTSVPTGYDVNSNNQWDPAEIRLRLQDTATDLGADGKDYYYGYGLVNAAAAVDATSPAPIPDPTPEPEGSEMHISDIAMEIGSKTAGRNTFTWALATVTIVDSIGDPVTNAVVSGSWSGITTDTDVGTTNDLGVVIVKSNNIKSLTGTLSGTFTFTVTDVVLTDWTYNKTANVENSDSITVPV